MVDEEQVSIVVNPQQITRLLSDIKKFRPDLSTGIRKQVREAGKIVMGDVADEMRSYPSSGKYGSTHMREQLAASLAVRMYTSAGAKKQGVQIVSNGKKLPASKQALVKAMNSVSFRHRVWGRQSVGGRLNTSIREARKQKQSNAPVRFEDQKGMRYFRAQVVRKSETRVDSMIEQALTQALEALS